MANKIYTIQKEVTRFGERLTCTYSGTLSALIKKFSSIMLMAHDSEESIKLNPKDIKELIDTLNRSAAVVFAYRWNFAPYTRTVYSLIK